MAAPDQLQVSFRMMTQADAVEISGWRYPPPYDFYDATADAATWPSCSSRSSGPVTTWPQSTAAELWWASRSWSPTAARSTWGWACGPTVMMARAEAAERDPHG
jgi:hypothetical protein